MASPCNDTICLANEDTDDEIFLPSSPSEYFNHQLSPTGQEKREAWAGSRLSPSAAGSDSQDSMVDVGLTTCEDMGVRSHAKAVSGSMSSIVDGLLFEIYDRWHYSHRDSLDSDTYTECSSTSEAFLGRCESLHLEEVRHARTLHRTFLLSLISEADDLKVMVSELQHRTNQMSAVLIRQLKHRDRRRAKIQHNFDIITAVLQASSLKRRIDTRMKFSIEPLLPGDDAFQQWLDAMKAVARLPLGIPAEFRKRVWLALADRHIQRLKVDWDKTRRFAFNERSNPDDNKLGLQIVKDLHRTGCSSFNGQDSEEDRVVLKRVLLAYARWNKSVGYCQGFNVLAALILDVVERKEDDALKVMILLIDHVLPESYFANNLRALSVDMAVFRDLLGIHFPKLSTHLDHLQAAARDDTTGANYEPPLTNVFTMQWFLTLFATCLPKPTALRVWDSVLLEGSEILLRTALAIWGNLQDRIIAVQSADEFYTTMGILTQEMLDDEIISGDNLIKAVYAVAPFPFPQLSELREKYTYNITPFTAAMSVGRVATRTASTALSDEDELDEDDLADAVNCFSGLLPSAALIRGRQLTDSDRVMSSSAYDISKVSPGAFAATPDSSAFQGHRPAAYIERMNLDIHSLKHQYKRLRQRQKQAHIILANATARHHQNERAKQVTTVAPIERAPVVNHLFIAKNGLGRKNRKVAEAPRIAPFYPKSNVVQAQLKQYKVQEENNAQRQRKTSTSSTTSSRRKPSLEDKDFHPQALEVDKREVKQDEGKDIDDKSQNSEKKDEKDDRASSVEQTVKPDGSEEISLIDFGEDHEAAQNDTVEEKVSEEQSLPTEELHQVKEEVSEKTGEAHREEEAHSTQADKERSEAHSTQADKERSEAHSTQADKERSENEEEREIDTKNCETDTRGQSSENRGKLQSQCSVDSLSSDASSPGKEERGLPTEYMTSRRMCSSQPDTVRLQEYSPSIMTSSEDSDSSQGSPTHDDKKKYYNPFPGRHISKNKAQNGIRLGLYDPKAVPFFKGGMEKKLVTPNIGRSQINACLHRQYMAGLKQQSKSSRR